jgi:hypothetical protein
MPESLMPSVPAVTVFVDTNCFLQLRDLEDLPWSQLLGEADHVEIAIAAPVLKELDGFKSGKDQRRRDRARAALNHFELDTGEGPLLVELRAHAPKLTLRLCPPRRLPWHDYPDLDPANPDDQLVVAALTEPVAGDRLLLSYDITPLLRARLYGLACRRSPEAWQLPSQKDEQTLELERLRRENAQLKSMRSQVQARIVQYGAPVGRIAIKIARLSPLPPEVCERLATDWMARHDALARPGAALSQIVERFDKWVDPKDMADYEAKLAAFPQTLREFFETLHEQVHRVSQFAEFEYRLENLSAVTANRLLVDLQLPEALGFEPPIGESKRRDIIRPPATPERPTAAFMRPMHHPVSPSLALSRPAPRDPTTFYRQDPLAYGGVSTSRICEEFRAKATFVDSYKVRATTVASQSGAICVNLSASNFTEPVQVQAGLLVEEVDVAWTDPDVARRLPRSMASRIANAL